MASLFKNRKIKEALETYEIPDLEGKIAKVKAWHDSYENKSLHQKTESQCEQAFNQHFFIEILGYTSFPSETYTIDPKGTADASSQKADAVLGYFGGGDGDGGGEKKVTAVVEIKDVNTSLERSQQRAGNMSPIQQAFKYKPQYKDCAFVIATNFWEIRLFRDDQLDFESFTLESLVDPADDYFEFRKFYYLLNAENFVIKHGKSVTEKLLAEIRIEQEKITKSFYKDYKDLRQSLINNLVKNGKGLDFDTVVEKAQKVIDRIVFICFCEDLDMLPENKLKEVVHHTEKMGLEIPVWDIMKGFFKAIDKGSKKLEIPKGYNGELFKEDTMLDSLFVDDEICKRFVDLGKYDFSEDLSVNILGHIFEQSISDIEELKSFVEEKEVDKKKSKRKKDGIFYTPDYIVDYIVKNSLGAYLGEKEKEIMKKHGLKEDIKGKNYEKRALTVYHEYQEVLRDVKVLDPACGSGAFLVKVFDYLLAENKRVADVIADLSGGNKELFSDEGYIKDLLENNIYGVDLNPESVEITKLSLWLKTAVRGKKLVSLKGNIKCGNSLIDDPEVAGNRAFKWEEEFKEIMESGGFDVVVGNPPYVSANELKKNLTELEYSYLKRFYSTAKGAVDLYIYFFEKGLKILKADGILSFITPNRFLSASYGKALREYLIKNCQILSLLDYSDKSVFSDASTYPVISFFRPSFKLTYDIVTGKFDENTKGYLTRKISSKKLKILNEYILGFLLNDKLPIVEKIINDSLSLANVGKINATSTASEADDYSKLINSNGGYKLINTGTIDPYVSTWGKDQLTDKGAKYLTPYLPKNDEHISDNRHRLYLSPKIIISKIGLTCEAFYDKFGEYASINTNCLHSFSKDFLPEYILCWLNSKLYNYLFECLFDGLRMSGGYLLYSSPNLKNTYIKRLSIGKQSCFIQKADQMLSLNKQFHEKLQKFLKLIQSEFNIEKITRKLEKFYELDFDEFVKALKLKKLSLDKKEELLEFFEKHKKELVEVKNRIDATDKEIDEMVFDLYGLSEEERGVVLGG